MNVDIDYRGTHSFGCPDYRARICVEQLNITAGLEHALTRVRAVDLIIRYQLNHLFHHLENPSLSLGRLVRSRRTHQTSRPTPYFHCFGKYRRLSSIRYTNGTTRMFS